jgi:hypothetical protein
VLSGRVHHLLLGCVVRASSQRESGWLAGLQPNEVTRVCASLVGGGQAERSRRPAKAASRNPPPRGAFVRSLCLPSGTRMRDAHSITARPWAAYEPSQAIGRGAVLQPRHLGHSRIHKLTLARPTPDLLFRLVGYHSSLARTTFEVMTLSRNEYAEYMYNTQNRQRPRLT